MFSQNILLIKMLKTSAFLLSLIESKEVASVKRRRRQSKSKGVVKGKNFLFGIGVILLIGMVVTIKQYLGPKLDYAKFANLYSQYQDYLIEEQDTILAAIDQEGIRAEDVGHLFIPTEPAHYIDIAHIPQQNVPYLNQNDPNWRNLTYGTDGSQSMWENGCAIAVLTMVERYYRQPNFPVNSVLDWAGNDYYIDGQGTNWQIYPAFAEEFDYYLTDLGNDIQGAVAHLQAGEVVIASVGPGRFTSEGHVMLLRGYHEGQIYLNDPNDSPAKFFSIQGIPAETLRLEALNYWAIRPN